MHTLRANQISVIWNNGQQKFQIVGGGLPRNVCWSEHERLNDASTAAEELADDMCLEIV